MNVSQLWNTDHMSIQTAGIIPEWTQGDRLRKAREAAGLDQNELAERIDISRRTVGNYESDRVEARMIVLKQWALATGVDLAWLIGTTRPGGSDASMVNYYSLYRPTLKLVG